MKVLLKVDRKHGDGWVMALRRVEKRNYTGQSQAYTSKSSVRTAVSKAVESLEDTHGRQIGFRHMLVPLGGGK